jgi:hypothetical protein
VEIDSLAASLRADAGDLAVFVEVLARKLEAAFPDATRVQRRFAGLRTKRKVERVEVAVGSEQYILFYRGGRVEARRATAVRGITVGGEPLSLDDWIESLARALAAEADESERGRASLEQLLGLGSGE